MSDKVEILGKVATYRATHNEVANLSDAQIISILSKEGLINLSESEEISLFGEKTQPTNDILGIEKKQNKIIVMPSGRKIEIKDGETKYYSSNGVELQREYFEKQEGKVELKPSGRYIITKSGKTKYYASNGVELKESYFRQVENIDVTIEISDGRTYNLSKTLENRINKVGLDLKKTEEANGFIGSAWSGFKNLTGIGDSSDDVREQQEKEKKLLQQFNSNEHRRAEIFKELTGAEYTPENLEKFVKGELKLKSEVAHLGYKEGQEMATDVAADMVSGIAAVGIYTAAVAAAPFTGGASIAVGLVAATASGAAIKSGLKAADALSAGREYTVEDLKRDAATGGFSGVLAPVTGGMGGAVGKTVATKFGVQVIKQGGKAVASQSVKSGLKQGIQTTLSNPTGYEYIGGSLLKRGTAMAAEMATDGALGGAVDNAFRAAYDGGSVDEILEASVEGFVGGAIMSPIIGGGMKSVGVAFNRIKGIDEFSSLVTNCKNLGDEDLINLYQYYKNYESECLAQNKSVPDMKQAGFDKLMEEINARGLMPEDFYKVTAQSDGELTEVAPFARRLEQTPGVEDLTNPEVKKVTLENGEFDDNGNFISDEIYTVTESGNPLAKSETFKRYPDGSVKIATNLKELNEQIRESLGVKKLSENDLFNIKNLLKSHPELSISDFSELLSDYTHLRKFSQQKFFREFLFSYNGLRNCDLKTLKANLKQFDKLITDLQNDVVSKDVAVKLSDIRLDFITKYMSVIKPEDFQKNLDFIKTLDNDFRDSLMLYDYDLILMPHSDKYFERVKIADDFNKYMKKTDSGSKIFIANEARSYEKYSDEEFAQILKNIELIKEMTESNFADYHSNVAILNDRQGLYTDLAQRVKEELGENFNYGCLRNIWRSGCPESSIAVLKALPDFMNEIPSNDLYSLGSYYQYLDAAGKKNFMDKLGIISKMPHLVDYNEKFNSSMLVNVMKERDIPNADKILEFINIAEPEFLEKINFQGLSHTFNFGQVFSTTNLENMIQNAKLHKDVPQKLLAYLKSEDSIIGRNKWSSDNAVNYQYFISPQILKRRVEQIKKFEGKYSPDILEHIYNGSLKVSDNTLEELSKIDQRYLKELISYRLIDDVGAFDSETLSKFVNYISKVKFSEDEIKRLGWQSNFNLEFFKQLTAEELDAISYHSLTAAKDFSLYHYEAIKEGIAVTPKKIRDAIKEGNTLKFYLRGSQIQRVQNKLNYLNTMSEGDLRVIGSKGILEYLDRSYDESITFNKINFENWKLIPAEVRNKFKEYSYNILKDEKNLDIERFNSRIQILKDKNVLDLIESGPLYYFSCNASSNIEKMVCDIISKPDFNQKDIGYVISSLRDFDGEDLVELNFVKELIENPKLDTRTLPQIFNSMYRAGELREIQKDFARYLLKRDGFETDLICRYLRIPKIAPRFLGLSKLRVSLAKELLNNPNISHEEIPGILNYIQDESFFNESRELILNMINSGSYKDFHKMESIIREADSLERIHIAQDLVDKNLEADIIYKIECSIRNREPKIIDAQRVFINEFIGAKDIDVNNLCDIISQISNTEEIANLQLGFARELIADRGVQSGEISYLTEAILAYRPEIASQKLSLVKELMKTSMSKTDICSLVGNLSRGSLDIYSIQRRMVNDFLAKNMPIEKANQLLNLVEYNNIIAPEIISSKIKSFVEAGVDTDLIVNICDNAKSLSIFNTEVINMLIRLKNDGVNVSDIISLISDGTIPRELQDKIDMLLTLTKFTQEDKLVLKRQGVDIDSKITSLMQAIDTKYPIISTSKENIHTFLKHIGNGANADAVIQNADFAKFGKQGISLEYSRDEFMRNMDKLVLQSGMHGEHISTEGIEVPDLKLSEVDMKATQEKIKELNSAHKTEKTEVIFEDGAVQGTRFLGTQGGSNKAYYTQIGDKLYYIKYPNPEKLGQSVEEVIASRLYRAAGIDSPNMKYVYNENGDIIGMAGEYVPNLKASPENKEQFSDGFAVDAWLANWDAPKNDNTQYRTNGVIKVDVGGSLRYRARGDMKDFGSVVNELSTLIEQNSQFMSMTKQDLLNSLSHVTEISDGAIQKIIDESPLSDGVQLVHSLIKRKEYMKIFTEKLKVLDEAQFNNILDMVNEARRITQEEFEDDINIAECLGYIRTKTGFEGILNTRGVDDIALSPEQRNVAQKMIAEIEKFTFQNRIADDVSIDDKTRTFLNSILKGIPEFAPIFGKPQHNNQMYSLDIHILKVLQDSVNDPIYKELGDTDKIVLKFATLLHDIGKRYLIDGSDTGHASKSAEYVYSILDRFNLTKSVKDRIISIVLNHHWFKDYNLNNLSNEAIATLCRRPEDFKIYQIMAKADLKNVNKDFYLEKTGASTFEEAERNFAEKIASIQPFVDELAQKQVVVTTSNFVEVPKRVTSTGKVLPARGFPIEKVNINGVETPLKVLNLSSMSEDTDMFQYGFNNIKQKDLRFLVHMVSQKIYLDVFKTLVQNPMNNSAQSISMISMANKSTYASMQFGFVLDVDNANVSHAYYANTASGTKKGFSNFVSEMFENTKHRSFVKDKFKEFMLDKGVELNDSEYAEIAKYIMSKKYPETQIQDLKVGNKTFSKEDLLAAFKYSRDQLIEVSKMKTHGEHNELVAINTSVKALVAKVASLEECPSWFLEFARENNLPIILIGL